MTPGEFFRYESCCPLSVPSGTMDGYFVFQRPDGSSFHATVPTMRFELPQVITEATVGQLRLEGSDEMSDV